MQGCGGMSMHDYAQKNRLHMRGESIGRLSDGQTGRQEESEEIDTHKELDVVWEFRHLETHKPFDNNVREQRIP